MLTYTIASNTVNILPLEKIVTAQMAKYFWNNSIESKYLTNIVSPFECNWERQLTNHRNKTICIANEFISRNELPSHFKTILKESIYILYQAFYEMLLWKKTYDSKDNTDLFQMDELHAPNYFTIEGHFNDFMWTKRFVNNVDCDIHCRFYLACFYWFESETMAIWTELKKLDLSPFAGKMDPLITLRIFQLENLQNFSQYWANEGNFWQLGLKISAERGYEYATYYFWNNLNEAQRIRIIQNNVFNLISESLEYPHNKISCFLYSQLSNENKRSLLRYSNSYCLPEIWLTLLLSRYSQEVPTAVIEFAHNFHLVCYSELLRLLAIRIYKTELPFDTKIFNVFWSNSTMKEKQFALSLEITQYFVHDETFYNLGFIIKSLSLKQKNNCLFKGWYGSWHCLKVICRKNRYDLLSKFLSFFLIELHPLTKNESLRKDAKSFLKNLIAPNRNKFQSWRKKLF